MNTPITGTQTTQANAAQAVVAAINAEAVKEKRLYKSTTKFTTIHDTKGRAMHFKMGNFITDDEEFIAFLDGEIAKNAFGGVIYIDPNARTITAEQENPMIALRKKFFQEFLAEQQAHMNPENDMGNSTQGPLNATSTSNIAAVAAGGGPTISGAKLVSLANKPQ